MNYHGIPDLAHLEEWSCQKIPFEYNDFMFPGILDNPAEIDRRICAYMQPARDRSHDTIHGPFLDITVHSEDSRIRQISDYRIRQVCDIALRLQAKAIVLHTNFIPNFYEPSYRKGWIDRNENYLTTLLQDYPDLYVYMENMFDDEPDCLAALAGRMQGQRFGICLDIAHANISKTPIDTWLAVCAPYITHYHINDNHGVFDEHLPLGEGNIAWREILPVLPAASSVLLEVSSFDKYEKCRAYLAQHHLLETEPCA